MKVLYSIVLFTVMAQISLMKNLMTKGPYHTRIISIKNCSKTSLPRPSPTLGPVDTYWAELYNTTKKINLLRARLTITQHKSSMVIKNNGYIWKDGKWKHYMSIPDIDCNSPIVIYVRKRSNITYDSSTCSFPKGVYGFKDVDLDKVQHFWSSEREYGRQLWKTEVMTKYNTVICFIMETVVEPLKDWTMNYH